MKWKDFLYFRSKERVAVIALLILIFLSAGVYLFAGLWTDKSRPTDDKKALAEFDEFQRDLQPVYYLNGNSEAPDQLPSDREASDNKEKSKGKLTEGQTVDLNNANVEALKRIPGIGDAFAKRILDYRNALGGFVSLEQLKEVKGFSDKKLGKCASYMCIRKKHKQISVNLPSLARLQAHPYLSERQIESLRQYLKNGTIGSIDDLQALDTFLDKDVIRLAHYLKFEK
ncbi:MULTISPECIES: ComEA family DNA-binding protein [unclassified Dysgonomonas]|uniref:ComEA family DNA-binding protein n=1 Tax=unclassified Dysgonomonas TaxID=2630389 RepID=UPI0024766211|nr:MULTISPECIES: helix-hairpin-helix domain-containing protein [unclassified Dysgonomonas]